MGGSFRSFYKDKHCGCFGDIGTLSFNGNKLITTGGGGAIITNNRNIAIKARHISTTAKVDNPLVLEHDEIGWNDRMPNINAALGVAQMRVLEERIIKKRELAKRYTDTISKVDGIEVVHEASGCRSNYWLITLRFKENNKLSVESQREELIRDAHRHGIQLRPAWKPLHKLDMYKNSPRGKIVVAENEALRLVNIPSSPHLMID